MKNIFFLSAFLLVVQLLSAQDQIIFLNGEEVQAKVLEVNPTEIKYKRFDNPDGPVYTVQKSEVFMIKYENGTKDVITDISKMQTPQQSRTPIGGEFKSPGLAFLFSFLLPGGGQYYNREHAKGGAMTGLWFAGIITTAVAASYSVDCYETQNGNVYCEYNENENATSAAAVGGMVMAGTWLWSVIDAPVRAARNNRQLDARGLLEFEKEGKYVFQLQPFNSPGLGGSLTMRF